MGSLEAAARVDTKGSNKYGFKNFINDFKNVFNIIVLQAAAVVTCYVLYISVEKKRSDTLMWHAVLCTIGYVLLMTTAIVLFSGDNILGRYLSRSGKAWIHGIIIGVGCVFAIAGISLEIDAKESQQRSHFKSIHGITGFTSMVLMLVAILIGGLILAQVRKFIPPVWLKIIHNFLGLSAFVIGMCSFCYGFETSWFRKAVEEKEKIAMITLSSIVTMWCAISPLLVIFDYIKTALK